jgi:AcrR family transcriptional regulator/kynurenine formamidase
MSDQTTREQIVAAADRLFYRQGFEHTSFANIAQAVQISRGNFYYHFKSKDEILDAVIEARLAAARMMLEQWEIEREGPVARIRSFIHILIANRADIKRYGCPVGALCTELAKLGHASQGEARELFTLFRTWLRRQFVLLGGEKEADARAMHLLARSQGVATLASAFHDEAFIREEVQKLDDWLTSCATPASSQRQAGAKRKRSPKRLLTAFASICAAAAIAAGSTDVQAQAARNVAQKSPWGPGDEIGTLNMMTSQSRFAILQQVASGVVYDLAVDMFVGMPTCCELFGDPGYQIWMTHAPARGKTSELLSHSGDVVSMSTHTGTHIDALNHFGLHGKIWNGIQADDAVGARGWSRSGADKYPPVIARGVLIDLAKSKNLEHLPASYAISVADLQEALQKQGTKLQPGDVVLIRTGLMRLWPDRSKYRLEVQAGLSLEAAEWLAKQQRAMLLGADNLGLEKFPPADPAVLAPVHGFLLAEQGVSFMEAVWLEDLARDQVHEFLFIAAPVKMRGATGAPIRPIAIPIRPAS